MARFYKLCAVSLILLVILQDAVAFKAKKEYKKGKELKRKGKYEEVFVEEGKTRQTKHHYSHQHNTHRPTRSVREPKVKVVVEEPAEDKIQYSQKGKKTFKAQTEEPLISKGVENTCGKKYECGIADKKKQKILYLAIDDKGKLPNERKGKASRMKQVYLSFDATDAAEEELQPEEVEYRIRSKKEQKARRIPTLLVLEESTADLLNEDQEIRLSTKSMRNTAPKYIMESESEIDWENGRGHNYVSASEDPIEEVNYDPGLNETDEEYEDFL